MLQTQGIVAPVVHAATAHLLPTAAVVAGTLLVLKVVVAGSWYKHRQKRKTAESKQKELEQKLEDLQKQYEPLKEAQQATMQRPQPATAAPASPVSGKQTLFEKIIDENIAIKEVANT